MSWTHVISDLNQKELIETFYKKELQSANQKVFSVETVIKKKRDQLYVKWNVHDSYFNIWINKKDII